MDNLSAVVSTHGHVILDLVNFCERYEVKFELVKVTNYREMRAEVLFTGFGEDIQLLKDEYEELLDIL